MSDENFKIKVVEILRDDEGKTSKAFGGIGQEFEVVDGVLIDLDEELWDGFDNFEILKKEFENNVYYRVRFEKVPEFPSFKVIVTENKKKYGCGDSLKWFGDMGTVLSVVDGELIDLQGFNWTNNREKYNNVEDINSHLKEVEFRIYEGEEEPKPSVVPYNGKFRVVRNIGSRSSEVIGKVGDVIEVKDGVFKSKTGVNWSNPYYASFQDIKRHLEERDKFRTEIEEVKDEVETQLYNGKIRIVQNVGAISEEIFGRVGTIIEVTNGKFSSKKGNVWSDNGRCYKTLQDIKNHIGAKDVFETIIEEVREQLPTVWDIDYLAKQCESPTDMTIEEIEEKLGYKIRIVSSKEVK